ncbi:MAG: hypothetical protein QME42_02145 [bacterium]|nr:hypothetical protein [bacterium]
MKTLELAESSWDSAKFEEYKKTHVRPFLKDKIQEIKTVQLKFGFKARKKNIDLSKIESESVS